MILKITGADYSANNIGTIDLRTSVNPSTASLLATYGKTWTINKQLAIEDFLTAFNSLSFKSKIKRLLLPILAPPKQILKNDGNQVAFHDLISNTRLVTFYGGAYGPSYTQEAYITANGFKYNSYTPNGNNNACGVDFDISTWNFADCHLGVYYHKLNSTGNSNILTDNNSGTMANIKNNQATLGFGTNAISTATYDVNTNFNRGLRIMSVKGGAVTGLAANQSFSATSLATSPNGTLNDVFILLNKYTTDSNINTTISLITVGDGLTQSETVEYNTIIETLMSKLWV